MIDEPWHGLGHCPACNALHHGAECPVCHHLLDLTPTKVVIDGVEHLLPAATQGAIPWSAYVLLEQIRLERLRPLAPGGLPRPSQRLVIVVLFWTLFETLVDGFYRAAFADLPGDLSTELLERFPSVGGRLDRLYRRTWGTTFWADLEAEGFAEEAAHLRLVQERRNGFIHGDPEAIDDRLVEATLDKLDQVQRAWMLIFNKRCTGRARRVPIWELGRRQR